MAMRKIGMFWCLNCVDGGGNEWVRSVCWDMKNRLRDWSEVVCEKLKNCPVPCYNALSIILLLFHFSPRYLLISSKNITSRTLLNFITNKSGQKSKDKTDKHQIITMFHVNTLLVCLPSLSSAACHVANDKGQYITWQVLSLAGLSVLILPSQAEPVAHVGERWHKAKVASPCDRVLQPCWVSTLNTTNLPWLAAVASGAKQRSGRLETQCWLDPKGAHLAPYVHLLVG